MKTIGINIKVLVTVLLITMFASSCNDYVSKEEHEKQMIGLTMEQQAERDSLENYYASEIKDIQDGIGKVRSVYSDMIQSPYTEGDVKVSKKDMILNDVNIITAILEENKSKITKLEKKLNTSTRYRKEIAAELGRAKEQMKEQELQLSDLKNLLAEKDSQINKLNDQIVVKETKISSLEQNILENTAYNNKTFMAVGTQKELKEKHIVKSKGGLLGIKKVDVLSEDLNKKDFEVLDKSSITTIPLGGTKPVIVTQHPKSSYEITENKGELATLTIKDADEFWKLSKYLVVEVKQ